MIIQRKDEVEASALRLSEQVIVWSFGQVELQRRSRSVTIGLQNEVELGDDVLVAEDVRGYAAASRSNASARRNCASSK
jgi:hypothetical protein